MRSYTWGERGILVLVFVVDDHNAFFLPKIVTQVTILVCNYYVQIRLIFLVFSLRSLSQMWTLLVNDDVPFHSFSDKFILCSLKWIGILSVRTISCTLVIVIIVNYHFYFFPLFIFYKCLMTQFTSFILNLWCLKLATKVLRAV